MATREHSITVERPADEIWSVIREFDNVDWYPGVRLVDLDGARRTIALDSTGMRIEQSLGRDDTTRTLTYRLTGFPGTAVLEMPDGSARDLAAMAGHQGGHIVVSAAGESAARIVYVTEADDGFDSAIDDAAGAHRAALAHLKQQLERAK